ncbi:Hypothetical Protein FCC1311_118002, partial [Hondaea fermentalgiana]
MAAPNINVPPEDLEVDEPLPPIPPPHHMLPQVLPQHVSGIGMQKDYEDVQPGQYLHQANTVPQVQGRPHDVDAIEMVIAMNDLLLVLEHDEFRHALVTLSGSQIAMDRTEDGHKRRS